MAVRQRKELDPIKPYIFGRSIKSAEDELGKRKRIIKLVANENNFGISDKVVPEIEKRSAEIIRYPDPTNSIVLERLTKKYGVAEENLIFSNGSFEMISIIAQTYLEPGDEVIMQDPTFGWYANASLQAGAKLVKIRVDDEGLAGIDKIFEAVNEKTKIIWFCNPNNPTGTAVDQKTLISLLERLPSTVLFVLDEAYVDFADPGYGLNSVELIKKYDNVISLHTFSKLYGLASFRLGFAYADAEIIRQLYRVRQPFNINLPAQIAAAVSLDDEGFIRKVLEGYSDARAQYYRVLDRLGLHYWDSQANFIMFDTGFNSDEIVKEFFE